MNTRDSSWRRAQESARRNATKGRLLVKIFYARPVGRALRRYLESNGNVLAGGVAYYSLASIAAALVLAVTIASFVVIGNETMRDGIVDFLGNAIPGIFTTDDGQTGLIDPSTLSPTPMSGVVGLIAAGIGWLATGSFNHDTAITWGSVAAGLGVVWTLVLALGALAKKAHGL